MAKSETLSECPCILKGVDGTHDHTEIVARFKHRRGDATFKACANHLAGYGGGNEDWELVETMSETRQKFEVVKQSELSYAVLLDGLHVDEFSDESSANEYVAWFAAKLDAASAAGRLQGLEEAKRINSALFEALEELDAFMDFSEPVGEDGDLGKVCNPSYINGVLKKAQEALRLARGQTE
jgi:hypothetical protein